MEKTGLCACGTAITVPCVESLVVCKQCKQESLFLCHVIAVPNNPSNFLCQTCSNSFTFWNCPKCNGSCAIKDFRAGHTYACACGLQATLLTCNQCDQMLLLPTRKNYQQTLISCKKCSNKFRFIVCQTCLLPTYSNQISMPKCLNAQCSGKYPQLDLAKPVYNYAAQLSNSNPYETHNEGKVEPTTNLKEESLCKVCLAKEATMVNQKCFHLAVCESCSGELEGKCPICRAVGGYSKVFKS